MTDKGAQGQATIHLDHEVHHRREAIVAGQELQGKVILQIESTFQSCDLILEVNGKEKTNATVDDKPVRDKHCFFRGDVNLLKKNEKLDPNTYVLPFTISLPKSLPASRVYKDKDGSFQIEYSLKIKSSRKDNNAFFSSKRLFQVVSLDKEDECVPCLLQPKPIRPDILGIDAKGKLFLAAHVTNTNVTRGQTLELSLACRNESTMKINGVKVQLEEEYYYTSKSFGGHASTSLYERDDIKRLPGIRVVGLHTSEVETSVVDEETIARRMFKDLKADGNSISIEVPKNSKETYSGLVIQVSHFVRFSVIPRGEEDMYPSIRIPIHIGSQDPEVTDSVIDLAEDLTQTRHVVFPLSSAKPDSIVLGRYAGILENDDSFNSPIPLLQDTTPSMETIREELAATINDFDYISEKMKDLDWAIFFASLTPLEFGTIVGLVSSEFLQPRIAALLAQNYEGEFTCAHCAAAIRNVTPVFKSNVVEGLLQFCTDLAANNHLIRGELSEFEQIIVALHALNEEDDPPEDDDIDHSSSHHRDVPMDILIGGSDVEEDEAKPPSDMTLETTMRQIEEMARKKVPKKHAPVRASKPKVKREGIRARRIDVILEVEDNPQTVKLLDSIKSVAIQGAYDSFCPKAFREIRKEFPKSQRFLIASSPGAHTPLHVATKRELIEYIGKEFDRFIERKGPADNFQGSKTNVKTKNWREALDRTQSEWELATVLHAYTADDATVATNPSSLKGPGPMDICLSKAKHQGNIVLVKAIRQLLHKDPRTTWGPPVYRAIIKAVAGRKIFVSNGTNKWKESNQLERREGIEKYFNIEKKRMIGSNEKSASIHRRGSKGPFGRSSGKTLEAKDKSPSSHRRFLNDGSLRDRASRSNILRQMDETKSPSGHRRILNDGSRRNLSRESDPDIPASPLKSRRSLLAKEGRRSSRVIVNEDKQGGSERFTRTTLFQGSGSGSGHRRRSRSAGKYDISANAPASPTILSPRRKSKSAMLSIPKKAPNLNTTSKDEGKHGEMNLNDESMETPEKRPNIFRRFSRKNSIRGIDKRNMKHPREMDICYPSEKHPGTVALTEAVIKAMNKFGNKPWGPPVYKAIRSDLQGRRFFTRSTRDSPWNEASNEEQLQVVRKLFEAKRRERRS